MAEAGSRSDRWIWLPIAAGVLFAVLAIHAARLETPTVDEFAHVPAGSAYLEHGTLSLYAKNPPLFQSLLGAPAMLRGDVSIPVPEDLSQAWGPWIYGEHFMRANSEDYFEIFFAARLVSIGATLGAAILVFFWAQALFGRRAGAIAGALFLLNPLILAHGHLATVDAGCAASLLFSAAALRWATKSPGFWRVALAGSAFGAALLVKFTALLFAPGLLLALVASRWKKPRRLASELAAFTFASLLAVNLGMGFAGSLRTLERYTPVSSAGRVLQATLPGSLPVPLPRDWVVGFDAAKLDSERGEFGSYLLGEWSRTGWWYHDLVGLFAKTPLPVVGLWLATPFALLRRRLEMRELALVLAPAAGFLLAMLAFNRVHIGVRYLLPLLPFLYIAAAALFAERRLSNAWVAAILVWHVAVLAWVHPNSLGHFSLGVGGPGNGHRVLADSNLDWGQDLYRVAPALLEMGYDGPQYLLYFGHVDPALYGLEAEPVPPAPVKGVLAVSVNYLLGSRYPIVLAGGRFVPVGRSHTAWLRELEPVQRLGSIWLFDTRTGEP